MKFNRYGIHIVAELVLTDEEKRIIEQCCQAHYDASVRKFGHLSSSRLDLSLSRAKLLAKALETGVDTLEDDQLPALERLQHVLDRVITNLTRRLCHAESKIAVT